MIDRQRIKWAAGVLGLFLIGLFSSQFYDLWDRATANIGKGAELAAKLRTDFRNADAAAVARDAEAKRKLDVLEARLAPLTAELATLQAKVRAGTATKEDVERVQVVVERIRVVNAETPRAGPAGAPGPPGPAGQPGVPGEDAPSTTTTTRATTSTTVPKRCLAEVDAVVRARLGC